MTAVRFEVLHADRDTGARRGRLHTPHGTVETPVFMPVGTAGSVKAVGPDELRELGAPAGRGLGDRQRRARGT